MRGIQRNKTSKLGKAMGWRKERENQTPDLGRSDVSFKSKARKKLPFQSVHIQKGGISPTCGKGQISFCSVQVFNLIG